MDRFNLGAYRRPISTRSAETQCWFDIGLKWCYGFNHEEGIKCFEWALESDPECAMVHWGIAYAAGPFYNLTWKEHGEPRPTARPGVASSMSSSRAPTPLRPVRSKGD